MPRSLYDRYQLTNSSAIPVYNGSNGDAAIKVSQYMQGLYDQNVGTAMQTSAGVDNMQGHPADQQIVNQTKEYYKGKLKDLSKSGDWENMMPQTQQLASSYARDAQAISGIQLQKQEWAKQLDDKEKDLTGAQKQGLLAIAEEDYAKSPTKLRRDGSGKLVGQYLGTRVDKNIDVAKKVDTWMKDAAVQEGGRIRQGTDGTWMTKVGEKWEKMSPAAIQNIIGRAAANDQEFQGYSDMMGRIESRGLDRINDPSQLKDGPYKTKAMKLATEKGIPFGQALKSIVHQDTAGKVISNALSYGTNKYTKDNHWYDQGLDADPFALKKTKSGDAEPDHTPTIIQGPNTKTTNDEQNLNALKSNTETLNTDLSNVDGQIKRFTTALQSNSLKPEERTQLQSNLNNQILKKANLQAQVDRASTIMNYSKMRTAQDMGYNSYDDFVQGQSKSIAPEVAKIIPTGLVSKSGIKINSEDLSKAILNGKVEPKFVASGYGTTLSNLQVTLEDGKKVVIPAGNKGLQIYNIMKSAQEGKVSRMSEFNKLNEQNHTKNVKDYSIEDNVMTLSKADAEDFKNAIDAAYDGVKFKKVGEFGELKDSDRPANYEVKGHGTPGPNGEARLMINELDDKGKPTGNKYEAVATNSNINEKMARKYGKQPTPEARQAAAMLTTGSPSTMLKGQPLGARLEIGKGTLEGKEVTAHITISGTEDKPEYNLTDEDGKIIHTTKSIGTAGQWINAIKGSK